MSSKRRAKKLNVPIHPYTKRQLSDRYSAFDNLCAYCDQPAVSIDHIISLASGGADGLYNLVPACKRCNSSKGKWDVHTWYSKQSFYSFKNWQKILRVVNG